MSLWTPDTFGLEKITANTISNDANITFETASAFDGTYSELIFVIESYVPATDNTNLRIKYKIAGTYQASNYAAHYTRLDAASTAYASVAYTGNPALKFASGCGTASGEMLSGELHLFDPNSGSTRKAATWHYNQRNQLGTTITGIGGGTYTGGSSSVTGIQFSSSSGNLSTGTITMYGVRA